MNAQLWIIQPQMQIKRAQRVTGFSELFSLAVGVRIPRTLTSVEEDWERGTPRDLCFRLACKS